MPSVNASIDDVVNVLLDISRQLSVATGFDSRYDRETTEQEEDKAEERVDAALTTNEKLRYQNIARQFESVLGVSALKDTLHALNQTLTDQQKNKTEAERASHIARHTTSATTAEVNRPTASPGMFNSLNNWMKVLGLGALLSLVGGIGAVTSSMMKVGPLYGIIQNVSKYASLTGLKTIITATGTFLKVLTAPFQLLSRLFTGKSLGKLIESGTMKMGGKFLLEKFPTIFKFLGKGLKFLKPIPIIGSLISFYFAWDRFQKGDITGGLIEVASGIASIFPGVGTAISIGLDMINLYRDISGKSAKEASTNSPNKTWLKDKMNQLGEFVSKNCYDWPIIGSLIRAYEHFLTNHWVDGINSLAHAVPIIGWMTDFLVKETDSRTGKTYEGKTFADVIKQAWKEPSKLMKNVPIIGDLLTAVDHFKNNRFDEGIKTLDSIVPGMGDVIKFLTPSPKTQQQLKSLVVAANSGVKSFSNWTLEKLGLGWLVDDSTSKLSNNKDGEQTLLSIEEKRSELYKKIKDFFNSMLSITGDLLKSLIGSSSDIIKSLIGPGSDLLRNLTGSSNDMSMQFINVLTTIKPSIDKANKELQLTFTSSLKEQLNALSQVEAVLYMQKDILEDNRSLLREIATNTRGNTASTPVASSYSELSPNIREERSFTRRSYINDVRSMNAVVRESLA